MKDPNAWGIFDMAGGAWEWVWDRYGDYSNGSIDPIGPLAGDTRVLRGGGWRDHAKYTRAGSRLGAYGPELESIGVGFRPVRTACELECDGKECSTGFCGGSCGTCSKVQSCQNFQCLCSEDLGYEPNEQCGQATALEEGAYPGLSLCPDDEDWFSVFLPAGSTLQASILFIHNDGDLDLYLYKEGDCLTPEDSSASGTDDEWVVFSTESSSSYLIRVAGSTKQVSNSYTLNLGIK